MQAKKLFCAAAAFAILITMTACNNGVSQPNVSGANDSSVTSSEITEPLDVTFPSTSSEAATAPEITTLGTSSEATIKPEVTASATSNETETSPEVTVPAASSETETTPEVTVPAASSKTETTPEVTVPAASSETAAKPEVTAPATNSEATANTEVTTPVTISETTKPEVTTTAASSEATTKPEVTTSVTSSEANESIPQISVEKFDIPQSEALEFVKNLKIGWNLGNTFDATDCSWLSDEMEYESAWNGEKTTEQHIETLKAAGFNSVRIPVSWHNHLTDKEKYTISKTWLDRVNEVVDYCINRDMYVIINIHHDNSKEFIYPSSEYLEQSTAYVTAIWKQLSERFKNYDEHLIFDSLNEPRLVGHNNEWWIDNNSADCNDSIECINILNQAFVDTVRASGGNNKTRYLMCPGYDASPDGALNDGFVLPSDPVNNNNRIMVSAHAYTPYNFALEDKGVSEWSSQNKNDVKNMVDFMDKLYNKFVRNGIPVVIDEFGARNKNENTASRVDFAAYYIAAARARGMSCFWWDNNAFNGDGENFGLLDRKTNKWKYYEIVQAMMKYTQ